MTPPFGSGNQLSDLLVDTSFKKNFFRTLDLCKKHYAKLSTQVFLEDCIVSGVIPPTFQIKNSPCENSSSSHKQRWSEGAKIASLSWMKSTVLELKTQNKESFKIYRDALTSLLTTLSESDKLRVEQTFSEKSSYYFEHFRKEKSKKFSFLTEKQDISVQKIKKEIGPGCKQGKNGRK